MTNFILLKIKWRFLIREKPNDHQHYGLVCGLFWRFCSGMRILHRSNTKQSQIIGNIIKKFLCFCKNITNKRQTCFKLEVLSGFVSFSNTYKSLRASLIHLNQYWLNFLYNQLSPVWGESISGSLVKLTFWPRKRDFVESTVKLSDGEPSVVLSADAALLTSPCLC